MTAALPVRVLVKGASTVCWTSPMSGPRSDFAMPRAVEAELAERGRASWVDGRSVPSYQASELVPTWQGEVLGFSPDAIVLSIGHFETIHLFVPKRVERYVNSFERRPGRLRERLRKTFVKPVYKAVLKAQSKIDGAIGSRLPNRRLRTTVRDVSRYIEVVRMAQSPLVILVEIPYPGRHAIRWFPGMQQRVPLMNEALRGIADAAGPAVARFVPTSHLLDLFDSPEDALPDGFHYSPRMHRLVAAEIAETIHTWAKDQPHLND